MQTRTLLISAAAAALVGTAAPVFAATAAGPTAAAALPVLAAVPPGAPQSFADLVERVGPAVVSIEVKTKIAARQPRVPEGFPFPLPQQPQQPQEARAAGTGFFISADGYIVTNNHVVEDATEVTVTLQDKRELKARVIGLDEATDLAVIKVEGRGFPFVSFATQARPRVGDWVIAVGNPFGLGGTATAGIVSANGRDVGSTFVDFLQVDAAINRGNSGGPTFDTQGRVIGVNSMIFSPSGGSVGIGFAIPADVAQNVTRELIANGKVTRGYIGANIQTLESEVAESLGLTGRKGALVADVVAGGPAEQAGLQSGDVVLAINGRSIESASQLTRQVASTRAGDTLRLDVNRNGAARTISIRAGTRPTESELAGGSQPGARPEATDSRLGLSVRPLTDADRSRLGGRGDVRGVVVEAVEPNTDAARKGIRQGDVIIRASDRPINSPADLSAAVEAARSAGRPSVLLFVNRQGRVQVVPVQLSATPPAER